MLRLGSIGIVAFVLLAGCTQLRDAGEDAQQALDEARTSLDEAKREAQEAKDRLDRVRSATIVRNETVDLVVVARSENGTTWFEVNATRAGVNVTRANLTALPLLQLATASWSTVCDPLTCLVTTSEDVHVAWADGAEGALRLPAGLAGDDARLERPRAWALVTTSAGDSLD